MESFVSGERELACPMFSVDESRPWWVQRSAELRSTTPALKPSENKEDKVSIIV